MTDGEEGFCCHTPLTPQSKLVGRQEEYGGVQNDRMEPEWDLLACPILSAIAHPGGAEPHTYACRP